MPPRMHTEHSFPLLELPVMASATSHLTPPYHDCIQQWWLWILWLTKILLQLVQLWRLETAIMAFTNLCATVTPCPCPWPWPSYSRIPSWISFYFYHSSYSCCHLVVQPTKVPSTRAQSYYCCHSYSSCCNSYAYLLLTFT